MRETTGSVRQDTNSECPRSRRWVRWWCGRASALAPPPAQASLCAVRPAARSVPLRTSSTERLKNNINSVTNWDLEPIFV